MRYVLSGKVRRKENRLRIAVELADLERGTVIWADRYAGDLSELFDLQERIATRIVWSLAPHVREAELKRCLRKRPENMNAYDLLLQAAPAGYRPIIQNESCRISRVPGICCAIYRGS